MIYSLKDEIKKEEFGNKAFYLSFLKRKDFPVPSGIIIPNSCFIEFLDHLNLINTIPSLINSIKKKPIMARPLLSNLREKILRSAIPDNLISEILSSLKENNIVLENGVAVRSSSSNEDKGESAFAGIFSSYINIKKTDELKEAVQKVWASAFSETAILYGAEKINMSVIIQQMSYGKNYGVAFSESPQGDGKICIEISKDVTGVVDNNNKVKTYFFSRNQNGGSLKNVLSTLKSVEKITLMKCDMEFCIINENEVHILQCRPISGSIEHLDTYAIFSQDDDFQCKKYFLDSCSQMYIRYLGKQHILRKAILDSGYNVYKQFFIKIGENVNFQNLSEELYNVFSDSNFLIIENGISKQHVMCRKEEAPGEIQKMLSRTSCVRVGEIIQADVSGYVSLNENGDTYVEYVQGRMQSIQDGQCPAARCIIKNGLVTYLERPFLENIEIIDNNTGRKTIVKYNKLVDLLPVESITKLEDFTKKMSAKFKGASFEWYLCNGILFGKDISIENGSIPVSSMGKNIMSQGNACGPALFMEDDEKWDNIAEKYDISLYAHSDKESEAKNDSMVINFAKQIGNKKPVIFMNRPSIGLLLISDYISGAVFAQGAILSHAGICFREKKIPAVIDKAAFMNMKNMKNKRVSVNISSDGEVIFFENNN